MNDFFDNDDHNRTIKHGTTTFASTRDGTIVKLAIEVRPMVDILGNLTTVAVIFEIQSRLPGADMLLVDSQSLSVIGMTSKCLKRYGLPVIACNGKKRRYDLNITQIFPKIQSIADIKAIDSVLRILVIDTSLLPRHDWEACMEIEDGKPTHDNQRVQVYVSMLEYRGRDNDESSFCLICIEMKPEARARQGRNEAGLKLNDSNGLLFKENEINAIETGASGDEELNEEEMQSLISKHENIRRIKEKRSQLSHQKGSIQMVCFKITSLVTFLVYTIILVTSGSILQAAFDYPISAVDGIFHLSERISLIAESGSITWRIYRNININNTNTKDENIKSLIDRSNRLIDVEREVEKDILKLKMTGSDSLNSSNTYFMLNGATLKDDHLELDSWLAVYTFLNDLSSIIENPGNLVTSNDLFSVNSSFYFVSRNYMIFASTFSDLIRSLPAAYQTLTDNNTSIFYWSVGALLACTAVSATVMVVVVCSLTKKASMVGRLIWQLPLMAIDDYRHNLQRFESVRGCEVAYFSDLGWNAPYVCVSRRKVSELWGYWTNCTTWVSTQKY
jgi:hypothetical protein